MSWLPSNKVPQRWAKCLAIVSAFILVFGFISATAQAGTAYDSGDDRYVILSGDVEESDTDPVWEADTEVNMSIPEELGTRSTIDFTLRWNGTNYSDSFWDDGLVANLSVSVQGETFYCEELDGYNMTIDADDTWYEEEFDVELHDLNASDETNDTISVNYEVEAQTASAQSATDSWSGAVKLVEHIDYTVIRMTELFISLIPLIVTVSVISILFKSLQGVFKDI